MPCSESNTFLVDHGSAGFLTSAGLVSSNIVSQETSEHIVVRRPGQGFTGRQKKLEVHSYLKLSCYSKVEDIQSMAHSLQWSAFKWEMPNECLSARIKRISLCKYCRWVRTFRWARTNQKAKLFLNCSCFLNVTVT